MKPQKTPGYQIILDWFSRKGWQAFPFQEECWQAYLTGLNGLLNAPTGSGKTFALWLPVLMDWINRHPDYKRQTDNGLQLLWITPLRSLTTDIKKSMQESAWELDVPWLIKARTGDTSAADKQMFKKKLPEVLITTPESLHVMLAQKDYARMFRTLQSVVIDEWHELLGSKRGVQVELALSRLRSLRPELRTWGISATIGNLDQALEVLLGMDENHRRTIIRARLEKQIEVKTIIPEEVERFPWAGHLGLKLASRIIPILRESRTTLIFLNTRGMTEQWYKELLENWPELAGVMALHHGSLDRELRNWVEASIHEEKLKVVICTSSLDLGVDFAPVETVIQVGSPKGVARFLQRAGRSGHRPGQVSRIYFLPTHSLELIESAALQEAIRTDYLEDRRPMEKPIDVLVQYLLTLAVSDGFDPAAAFIELRSTYAYRLLHQEEMDWLLQFITTGGHTLRAYNEYQKAVVEDGLYKITNRRIAMLHRLSIGTIISDPMMRVSFLKGSSLGSIEESFISSLKPGDVFWFAGRNLEFLQAKELIAYVRKSNAKNGRVPSWSGARLSLSVPLANMIRKKLDEYRKSKAHEIEMNALRPLLDTQKRWSALPGSDRLLIEKLETKEGFHLFFYPFAGRSIHEGLAALTAYRLAQFQPITFSIAMNDYGFELLSEDEADLEHAISHGLFSTDHLHQDMELSLNETEMAKRRFREIAQIAGLLFAGYPGKSKKKSHLQASSSLLFDVFQQYDPDNLLLRQAHEEVFTYQLNEDELKKALVHINANEIKITKPHLPTPFGFPIMVDRLRDQVSSEKLEDRIKKMKLQLEMEE